MEQSCLRSYLKVKRRRVWVKRFVVVEDGLLTYYKTASDLQPRGMLNLAHCKLTEGDLQDGKITLQLAASFTLLMEFPDKQTFDLWKSVMVTPKIPNRSVEVLTTEVCQCAADTKLKLRQSKKHLADLSIEDLKPHLKAEITALASKEYHLDKGHANTQLFKGPTEEVNSDQSFMLTQVTLGVGLLILGYFGLELLNLGLLALVFLHLTNDIMTKPAKLSKTPFKSVALIHASIGDIYSVLNNSSVRPLWEPHCVAIDSVNPKFFSLRFTTPKGQFMQELTRTNAGDELSMYYIESAGVKFKQAFLMEDYSLNCKTMTKMIHYGYTIEDTDPLVGNSQSLSTLKTCIESLLLPKPVAYEPKELSVQKSSIIDPVSDEEDAIDVAGGEFNNLPEADRIIAVKYNEDLVPVMKDLQDYLAMNEGWEPIKLSSEIVTGFRRPAAGGLFVVKGTGVLKFSTDRILSLLKDLGRKTEYDEMFESGNVVQTISSDMEIVYQRFKKQFPASGRDFCILQRRVNLPNGQVIAAATSTTHPNCPPVKGLVRATLHMGAFVLEPAGDNATKITYLTYVDLGGSVPGSIANMVQKKQPLVIEALGRALARS